MRYSLRPGAPFDPRAFIEAEIEYLRVMSEGMAGMVHANDVRIAEGLRDIELPADPTLAIPTWNRALNDAVMSWHRDGRATSPTSTSSTRKGSTRPSTTASRTTSCCRCTAARRRTASARWGRRRR